MSFTYYKTKFDNKPAKLYGFRKASSRDEMRRITERMQRKTVSTKVTEDDRFEDFIKRGRVIQPRPKSPCRRTPHGWMEGEKRRTLSQREMNRIVHRLQRPTVSYGVAVGMFKEAEPEESLLRPKSAPPEERKKSLQRIRRPTTASRGKRLSCQFCEDRTTFDSDSDCDLGEVRPVTPFEVDEIFERVQSATVESLRGNVQCAKLKTRRISATEYGYVQDTSLPLISGLKRSKKIAEIVERLYTGGRR